MENLLGFVSHIKSSGIVSTAIKANLPIPMVATQDIALKAAEFLNTLKFTGQTIFDFDGPRDVTMAEATKILGKALGKSNVKYMQVSYEQAEKEMIAAGMKHQMAKLMVDMQKAYNEKDLKPTQKLTAEHKGTTTFEEFCKTALIISHPARKAA